MQVIIADSPTPKVGNILSTSIKNRCFDVANIQTVIVVSSTPVMKDSYYFADSSGGTYLHIGPQDFDFIVTVGSMAWGTLSTVIGIAIGAVATPFVGAAVAVGLGTLGIITVTASYMFENADGSMDLYFPPDFAFKATLAIMSKNPVPVLMGVGGKTIVLVL